MRACEGNLIKQVIRDRRHTLLDEFLFQVCMAT
jgi:hypothetical protein